MLKKEFEGKTWVSVEDFDELNTKLVEASRKRTEAEGKVTAAEKELADAKREITAAQALGAEVQDLRDRLSAADAKYERHTAIAALGITDPDVIETIEQKYNSVNGKLAKKDQLSFPDMLEAWSKDPAKAPTSIRSHFEAPAEDPAAAGAAAAGGKGGGKGDETAAAGAGGGAGAAGAGGGTGARKLPARPKTTPTKPGPAGKPLTTEDIYGAQDEKSLDALVKQYRGEATE